MRKDYSTQLSALLVTLTNINDHLRKIEDKLSADKSNEPQVFKHIVAYKPYKEKENTNGKISQ